MIYRFVTRASVEERITQVTFFMRIELMKFVKSYLLSHNLIDDGINPEILKGVFHKLQKIVRVEHFILAINSGILCRHICWYNPLQFSVNFGHESVFLLGL